MTMIRSYFTTAIRFLLKNRTFSIINIVGLSTGILCCLYILLYVQEEYSYDQYYTHARDIYRVNSLLKLPGASHNSASCSPPIVPAMKRDFPEVKQFTRVVYTGKFGLKEHLLQYRDKSFYETDADFVDSTFFDVFNFYFISGSAKGALADPYTVVLLKPTADKLFGLEDPVGKVITINNEYGKHDFKVTGVIDERLGRSHIHANLFMSMNSGGIGSFAYSTDEWAGENFAASYVQLAPHADVAALEKKLPAFLEKYGAQQLKTKGMEKQLRLQPVGTIHTTMGYDGELGKPVSPAFLRILVIIAILIQVIACINFSINFMNLSTARASKRAKEVGVRKVIGAGRRELIQQFLGESFFLALAGMLVALPLLSITLPYLNAVTHANIQPTFLSDHRVWIMLAALVLVSGLLAASYPAFYLSGFQPIKVMKGNFTSHISVSGIRRALVVFQFALSIILIAGIVIIYTQLRYIANKDLGFDRDQKMVFGFYTPDARNRMSAFMTDMGQLAEVRAASKATNYPSQSIMNDWPFHLAGGNMATAQEIPFLMTDEHFLKAAGIGLVSGRDFLPTDSGRVIINETLARKMGIDPTHAAGTLLYDMHGKTVEIVGVLKDFHYGSLHEEIKPFMLRFAPNGLLGWGATLSKMIVSINSNNYPALLEKIKAIWKKDLPGEPFQYVFLDDEVQKQYETEITLSRIINAFTGMAILISCLGLFGLAAFSAEQRQKEIGIRKVLGAGTAGIVGLLSMDFLRLVGVAFVIATPVAWWAMHVWLQGFVYRVEISWWMFAIAGGLSTLIAMGTVSIQAIKAAVADPAESLRSE
jgi:putative ABC transport system permease protein